jgi:hypothetical protein
VQFLDLSPPRFRTQTVKASGLGGTAHSGSRRKCSRGFGVFLKPDAAVLSDARRMLPEAVRRGLRDSEALPWAAPSVAIELDRAVALFQDRSRALAPQAIGRIPESVQRLGSRFTAASGLLPARDCLSHQPAARGIPCPRSPSSPTAGSREILLLQAGALELVVVPAKASRPFAEIQSRPAGVVSSPGGARSGP